MCWGEVCGLFCAALVVWTRGLENVQCSTHLSWVWVIEFNRLLTHGFHVVDFIVILRECVGSGTTVMHGLTARGQWAMELLQRIATLPGGSGQCNSCNALPHRLGAVGSGTPAMRGPTGYGDGESCPGGGRCLTKELLQCTASLPGGSGQ